MQKIIASRCPFETNGITAGTILTRVLGTSREERMATLAEVFASFHADTDLIALRLILPDALLTDCKTIEQLDEALVPYQAETHAAEIDYRLAPFLPYQRSIAVPQEGEQPLLWRRYARTARQLVKAMRVTDAGEPASSADIAHWLECITDVLREEGNRDTYIAIWDTLGRENILMATIPGSVVMQFEENFHRTDPSIHRNLFGIVKCPFYPETTWRYSKDIELVLTRAAHFYALDEATQRRVRRAGNEALRAAGFVISDLNEDKQDTGLWLPQKGSFLPKKT